MYTYTFICIIYFVHIYLYDVFSFVDRTRRVCGILISDIPQTTDHLTTPLLLSHNSPIYMYQ